MRASLKQGPDRLLQFEDQIHIPCCQGRRNCINIPRRGATPQPGIYIRVLLLVFFPSKKDGIWIRHICVLLPMGGGMLTISHLVREGWVRQDRGSRRHHTALHVTAQSMLTSASLAFLGVGATPGLWRGGEGTSLKAQFNHWFISEDGAA